MTKIPDEIDADKLSVERQGRLAYLEGRVFWTGRLTVRDLMTRFGMSRTWISRDITFYRKLRPENLLYEPTGKFYYPSTAFEPLYLSVPSADYFEILGCTPARAFSPVAALAATLGQPEHIQLPQRVIPPEVLRTLVRALGDRLQLQIEYQSMTRPEPAAHVIEPHHLVFNGFRWHVRAYSHTHDAFRDFLPARVLGHPTTGGSATHGADDDTEWRETLEVRIAAHPGLTRGQRRVIETDYGMRKGQHRERVRVALVGYYLKALGIGPGDTARDAVEQQIVLANPDRVARYAL